MGTTQISVRIEDRVLEELDKHVDGINYRSRAQVMLVALIQWLQARGSSFTVLDQIRTPQQPEDDLPALEHEERRHEAMLKGALRRLAESGELEKILKPSKDKKR